MDDYGLNYPEYIRTSSRIYQGAWKGYYGTAYSDPAAIDLKKALKGLMSHLKTYDHLRLVLEQKGGSMDDLKKITQVLQSPFSLRGPLKGRLGEKRVFLVKQEQLRNALRDIHYNLHLGIRMAPSQMPAYYLCRIRKDYWGEYSLVVEDLYMSPGYPLPDERFIKLMDMGHENYHLRLSPFREAAGALLDGEENPTAFEVDDLLYDLGRNVFQAAWHEDQRLAVSVARQFDCAPFRHAIELLYLCLSGELCELRSAFDRKMTRFFQEIYPQPAIRGFLGTLKDLDGHMLNHLPRHAAVLFKTLSRSFSRFLGTEVTWGNQDLSVPLWKILYANMERLHLVGRALGNQPKLRRTAGNLKKASVGVINDLLALPSSDIEQEGMFYDTKEKTKP